MNDNIKNENENQNKSGQLNNNLNDLNNFSRQQNNNFSNLQMGSTQLSSNMQPVNNINDANSQIQNSKSSVIDSSQTIENKLTEQEKGTVNSVESLNKEDAMEEALSHTNQYPPFQQEKVEINKNIEKPNKSSIMFFVVIFAILLVFIIFLPKIAKLFGW